MAAKLCHCLLIGLLLLGAEQATAQVTCRADISYRVTKGESTTEVFFSYVERQAQDEATAKQQVLQSAAREKGRALDACRRTHQDLGGCIGSRLMAQSGTMSAVSFTARKAIEDAVKSDCELTQGTCGEVVLGESACTVLTPPAPEPAAGDKKGDKKDERKKK
jgi:hypothetical protein